MKKRLLLALLSFVFVSSIIFAQVSVQFIVAVPPETPENQTIYITGNSPLLGEWKADGLKAKEIGPNLFLAESKFPAGTNLEFKVTRGSFKTVEKASDGLEVRNRKFIVPSKKTASIKINVAKLADLGQNNNSSGSALKITGFYKQIKQFASKNLTPKRDIVVLLPPSYFQTKSKSKSYPVFYMHDGNNLFDPSLSFTGVDWGVDEACAKLYEQNKIDEVIVVGIYNTVDRNSEYTPFVDPKHGGGNGDKYSKFLIEELKPYIDSNFRTKKGRENTAIGGSSLGGLISIYVGLSHPEIFGSVMAMSPSIWWADGKIIDWVKTKDLASMKTKLWVDIGTNEGEEGVGFAKKFVAEIKTNFENFKTLKCFEVPGASHTESAWKDRIHLPLIWFFAK